MSSMLVSGGQIAEQNPEVILEHQEFNCLATIIINGLAALQDGSQAETVSTLAGWYDDLEVCVYSLATAFEAARQDGQALQIFAGSAQFSRDKLKALSEYSTNKVSLSDHHLIIPPQQITGFNVLVNGSREKFKTDPLLDIRVISSQDKPVLIMSPDGAKVVEQPSAGRWYRFILKTAQLKLDRLSESPAS